MCGIVGFFAAENAGLKGNIEAAVVRMALAIQYRGPDDTGIWCDEDSGIVLAHRRLSIVDLSPAGHQPMHSFSGRYVIVFNGEIYNHIELRKRVKSSITSSHDWRGHSDTETLLACFDVWGIRETLISSVGMFALALWDRKTRTLTLARDRVGEKPLYYGWQNKTLLFGSELKAIKRHPSFSGDIDCNAIALLMRYNYIPAPHSIYKGIRKLMPGTFVQFQKSGLQSEEEPKLQKYWSLNQAVESGILQPFSGNDDNAVEELDHHLRESVRGEMMADVPLGAFLSGGVDSSAVVALMQAQSARPVKTFSIGFQEDGYNEAEYAKAVAKHLGTEHTELYVSSDQAMAVIPRLPAMYDEPFSDSSQIPTFLVSEMAKQQVTVSLSGDGGDELFGGYNRYIWANELWRRIGRWPFSSRKIIASAVCSVSPKSWNRIVGAFDCLLPDRFRFSTPGDKLHKLAGLFGAQSPEAIYRQLISHWNDPDKIVLNAAEPDTMCDAEAFSLDQLDFVHRMMALDTISYLPDDILVKVDRAAMAVSLETRVPFLDHRVIEFAWRLPLDMKIRHGQAKWILRQVLYKYVPRELIERPKMGFGVPIDNWLRGPLREWAESLLDESRLRREGFFCPEPIRQKWNEHLSGARNWQYHLWDVLMFQAWLEANS